MHCGQENLETDRSDCDRQMVSECDQRELKTKNDKWYCFTRQYMGGHGKFCQRQMVLTCCHQISKRKYTTFLDQTHKFQLRFNNIVLSPEITCN